MFKKISSLISIGTVVITCILVPIGSADHGEYNVSEHKKMTKEQNYKEQQFIKIIYTHFGEFVRVEKEGEFKENEIARNTEQINSNTKELIFDYGIFIKK